MDMMPDSPQITVIFLLYNAEDVVEALVDAAFRQVDRRHSRLCDWLELLFMDDGSQDRTVECLNRALEQRGFPGHCRVVVNEKNLGLSQTLNKAFSLIRTPYGLTCHLDVLFGRDDYVAEMLALMDSHPQAGAITGQPRIPLKTEIPTAEKFNIISNLMDIFPSDEEATLVPVGFVEGRCDIFRLEALEKADFWDTALRASGEDQILAARMRQNGFELYQAPNLPYYLSVSDEQNSIGKLLRHAHLFGRTQPYILLVNKAVAGAADQTAGTNRRARMLLRTTHLAGSVLYVVALVCLVTGMPAWLWTIPLLSLALVKGLLFRRHLAVLPLKIKEAAAFLFYIPLQDLFYAAGVGQGVYHCLARSKDRLIR